MKMKNLFLMLALTSSLAAQQRPTSTADCIAAYTQLQTLVINTCDQKTSWGHYVYPDQEKRVRCHDQFLRQFAMKCTSKTKLS